MSKSVLTFTHQVGFRSMDHTSVPVPPRWMPLAGMPMWMRSREHRLIEWPEDIYQTLGTSRYRTLAWYSG